MFSIAEKKMIATKIEELLLALKHPEMPNEKPKFRLHVDGKEDWSFADIVPNWTFGDSEPTGKAWNEISRDVLGEVER